MSNIKEIEIENMDGTKTIHIIEEFAPGEFRSMTKAHWDELQARQEAQSL